MRPEWAARYLNIPFIEQGRDRAGVDCYGLLRLVYQEQRGIDLPSYTEGCTTKDDMRILTALARGEVITQWHPVPLAEVRLFDAVIFRMKGEPIHVGLVLDAEYFLHSMRGVWSVIERMQSIAWRHRIVGAMRYA